MDNNGKNRALVPISEEEMSAAYGACSCKNCREAGPVRAYRCCYKDCITLSGWTSFISTNK